MATKDTPTGLLARVANFVRSPAAEPPARNLATSPEEGEAGKQTIKRMIERKAHNDAVRQREFSQLRKLREASPAALSEMAARASFFQDSSGFAASVGRESTLRKIDDIEAQMSKQWWKGQQGPLADTTLPARLGDPVAKPGKGVPAAVAPSQLDTFAPTIQNDLDEPDAPPPIKAAAVQPLPASFDTLGQSGFSNSKMVSIDMGQALSDPVLEDAAIRFANSDDTGAESVLLLALQGEHAAVDLKDTWTTALLDMYRCTGQLANYERLALEFAQRSDRGNRHSRASRQRAGTLGSPPGYATWQSPAILDKAAVLQLQASVASGHTHTHTRLDWLALKAITAEAAKALASVMAQWCEQPLTLQFENLEMLDAQLCINTPVGDSQVPHFWWQLRLNTLRVLAARDEFELVSMDYCVTYEVSPPAWQSACCHRAYAPPAPATSPLAFGDDSHDTTATGPLTEATPFVDANATRVALAGEVTGSAAAGLNTLQAALQANADVLVNGDSLVRVDFSAAGSILNWVASAQAAGKKVEFCRLPHLVAAFFNLIGINEHARVSARAN